jgi:hypothetical protein
MEARKKARLFSALSAILFAIMFACSIADNIYDYFYYQQIYSETTTITISAMIELINIVIYGLMSFFLFIGKKNEGFIIIASVSILVYLYYIISSFNVVTMINLFKWISLLFLFLINFISQLNKAQKITKWFAFVPAFLQIIKAIVTYDKLSVEVVLGCAVFILPFIFLGLWLREICIMDNLPTLDIQKADIQETSYIGDADKLSACKELLDLGLISQEEFEEKKNQILKL